jgi:hypothetical protein
VGRKPDDRGCSQVTGEIGITSTPVIVRLQTANPVIYICFSLNVSAVIPSLSKGAPNFFSASTTRREFDAELCTHGRDLLCNVVPIFHDGETAHNQVLNFKVV